MVYRGKFFIFAVKIYIFSTVRAYVLTVKRTFHSTCPGTHGKREISILLYEGTLENCVLRKQKAHIKGMENTVLDDQHSAHFSNCCVKWGPKERFHITDEPRTENRQ